MKPHSCGPLPASRLRQALRHIPLVAISALGALLTISSTWAVSPVILEGPILYDGPNHSAASQVVLDGNQNVIVTGTSGSAAGAPGFFNNDIYTVKYDSSIGFTQWANRFTGPFNDEDPAGLAVDGSGNVIMAGTTQIGGNVSAYYTAKYAAANGALLWEKFAQPAPGSCHARGTAVDGNGDVIVTGTAQGDGPLQIYTVKYAAADGTKLWERYDDAGANRDTEASALALDGDGNVIVAGSSHNPGGVGSKLYTAKYAAADGALVWRLIYDAPGNAGIGGVRADSHGNALVAAGIYTNGLNYMYTAKYAAEDGALLWERKYSGPTYDDRSTGLAVDGNDNVIVTGISGFGQYPSVCYTAKYAAADGALLWENRTYYIWAYAVGVDANGDVAITGQVSLPNSFTQAYTAKYAAENGSLLWEARFGSNGSAGQALAVTLDGRVIATGYKDSNNEGVYATAKFLPNSPRTRAATGIGLSTVTFNGTPNPAGRMTMVRYEWGTTPALGNGTADQSIAAGTYPVNIPETVGGLGAGTQIFYRIRTQNIQKINFVDQTVVQYGDTLSVTTQFPADAPLQVWKTLHLGDAYAADAGDSDHDGLRTLAEYGLGLDPQIPNTPLGASAFDYAEGRRLRMFIGRDPAHNDVTVEVQAADSITGPWTTAAMSTLGAQFSGPGYVGGDDATPGMKTVEVRDTVNISDAAQRFMRVQVTHPAVNSAAAPAAVHLRKIALPRKGRRSLR
jgi:hypothetical protein